MCGTLFRQILLTFHLLLYLNGWSSRLTYGRFNYVILDYYQCQSWPYNPVYTCFQFHVYVLTFYVYVFM